MQSSPSVPSTSGRRFRVRDLSSHYGAPTFDLVFLDVENGVERHSEAIWNSQEQAILEAEHLDAAQLRPLHWEARRQNSGDLVNF
jgi:hypothetical protein